MTTLYVTEVSNASEFDKNAMTSASGSLLSNNLLKTPVFYLYSQLK